MLEIGILSNTDFLFKKKVILSIILMFSYVLDLLFTLNRAFAVTIHI